MGPASTSEEVLGAASASPARTGLLIALATVAMALSSAVQAILYLSHEGVTARTDAFFTAFALYSAFGIFCQAIRVTSVPLLVAGQPLRGRSFAAALAVVAIPVGIVCEAAASPVSSLLAPSATARALGTAQDALRILGLAMILQLAAAGLATLLGVWHRFETVAAGYVVGAVAGLVAFVPLRTIAGPLSLGWSMLLGSAFCAGAMLLGLMRARHRSNPPAGILRRPAAVVADAVVILRRTLVYFVFNALVVITIAAAGASSHGSATVLSFAYLFASYLVAITGAAIGISRIPDLARGAQDDWADVVADTVPHGFRYSLLLAAPALAGLVAAGAALVGATLPMSLPGPEVATLERFGALLAPWLVGALLVNLTLPAMFALGRSGLVNGLAPVLLVVHIAATLAGRAVAGADGAVAAMGVTPLMLAVILLGTSTGRRRREVATAVSWDTVRFGGAAVVSFGLGAIALSPLGASIGRAAAALAVGGALYAAGVLSFARGPVGVLLAAGRGQARGSR